MGVAMDVVANRTQPGGFVFLALHALVADFFGIDVEWVRPYKRVHLVTRA